MRKHAPVRTSKTADARSSILSCWIIALALAAIALLIVAVVERGRVRAGQRELESRKVVITETGKYGTITKVMYRPSQEEKDASK